MISPRGLLLAGAMALTPAAAEAQPVGTITGRVMNRATGEPVTDALVQLVGTTRTALSGANGSFRVGGVPEGSYRVRVNRIGYGSETQSVVIEAGATVDLTFRLVAMVAVIDEIVVTATGEPQRRRESGASTAIIQTTELELPAIPTLSALLNSRSAGLTVQASSGTSGTASRIRIRGSNSINLSNEPLLIIDGVRASGAIGSFSIDIGGQTISRLDDLNPEDIETVEVIKGPAAAALYGTAAANGVIQISTKRGSAGPTRWNWYGEYGTIQDAAHYPDNYNRIGTALTTGASMQGCTLEREILRVCSPKPDSVVRWNPLRNANPLRHGWRQTFGLNAGGGSEAATYYLAGEYEHEQGVYDPNRFRRVSLRSNLRFQLRNDLDAVLNLGFVRYRVGLLSNDNSSFGPLTAGLFGKAFDCSPATYRRITYCGSDSLSRGYFNPNAVPTEYFAFSNTQSIDRLTASLHPTWTPFNWLRGVAHVGLDLISRTDEWLLPPNEVFFNQSTLEGGRYIYRGRLPTYSADATLTGTYQVPGLPRLAGRTSAGGQYSRSQTQASSGYGAVLLPGTGTLNGTSARFEVGETNTQVVSLGWLAQQQLSYQDRVFVTLALRSDRGSTFGPDVGWVAYPAASLSWVISDEGFFPRTGFLTLLRLRAAYGESGRAPGFRDGATFFVPVSVRVDDVEVSGITVGGSGNATLRPEVSKEWEAGFETSLFGDRLGLELTGYRKLTIDALVARRLAPSLGASASRLENVGTVENRGLELLARSTPLDARNARWESTVAFSSNRNTLKQLGRDVAPILLGHDNTQQHRGGYPLGGYFARKLVSYEDLDRNGVLTRINCPSYSGTANPQQVGGPRCEVVLSDSVEYLGGALPTREISLNSTLTLFRHVRISGVLDYRGGFKLYNNTGRFRCGPAVLNCTEIYDPGTPLPEQARAVAASMGSQVGYIEDASFWKLRELAVALDAPRGWARHLGARGLSLTLAGRNLATWTTYTGLDPEVNSLSGFGFATDEFATQPPVRYFVMRLNLTF